MNKKATYIAIDCGSKDGDHTCEMEFYKDEDGIVVTNCSLYKFESKDLHLRRSGVFVLERNSMKNWWQSKTILASLMTMVTVIVGMLSPEISERLSVESPMIVEAVIATIATFSTGLAIVGRIVAKDDIKKFVK